MFRFQKYSSRSQGPQGAFGFYYEPNAPRGRKAGAPLNLRLSADRRRSKAFQTFQSFAALCLTAAITVIVSNSGPMDKLIARLQLGQGTATALAMSSGKESHRIYRPLFGPTAVEECSRQCSIIEGSGAKACVRACEKLSLAEYARRITFPEIDPRLDADKVVASCQKDQGTLSPNAPADEWKRETEKAAEQSDLNVQVSASREMAGARLRYEQATKTALGLAPPTNATPRELSLTVNIRRAACLRANFSLSELGYFLAAQNNDGVSKRYYQKLSQLLKPATLAAERGLLAQTKAVLSSSTR